MNRLSNVVIRRRKIVIAAFMLLALLGVLLSRRVSVNFKLADYLPKDAPSTAALSVMEDEFGDSLPNARVMLMDVGVSEALEYKEKLKAIEGISSAVWLDDVVGAKTLAATPYEFLDESLTSNYYKDDNALIYISVESGKEAKAIDAVYELIGEKNSVTGQAVNLAVSQELTVSETLKAIIILVPVILFILIISATSWVEPLFYLVSIGIAVLINMGTDCFFGEISFVTKAVSPILQLAVSLDYAIFLMHSFNEYRQEHEPNEAMRLAMKRSISAVAASAATTVIGFLALMFMRFSIGFDLGANLVKGVILSFISVMVFMPALTLAGYRLIDKTRHRRLIPDLGRAGGFLMKIRLPFLLLAAAIAVPCFFAQKNLDFKYGADIYDKDSRAGKDAARIESVFGRENQLVLLVPKGEPGREAELCAALADIRHITGVASYAESAGSEIPEEYLTEVRGQFYSASFSRVILYTDTDYEGPETFEMIGSVRDTAARFYDTAYLAGQSAALYDMKSIVPADNKRVNLLAVVGILAVLLLTFKSLSLPVLLFITIEAAIYINLSFAYFAGQTFQFIGYLVISTVQLGATVDYAILLTDRYLAARKELPKKEAMKKALGSNITAVLTSAAILSVSGFILSATSTNQIIAELGVLLFRGTLLSLAMVVCVLPALLVLFDRLIIKTTFSRKEKTV